MGVRGAIHRTTVPVGLDDLGASALAFLLGPWLDHPLLMPFARPMHRSADRAIPRTLRMALAGLVTPQCPDDRPVTTALAYPVRPQKPHQQECIA